MTTVIPRGNGSKRTLLRRLSFAGLVIGISIALSGCDDQIGRAPMPSSDSTPPTLTLAVYNFQTKSWVDHPTDAPVSVKSGERYSVDVMAADPEGVGSIVLRIGSAYMCMSGNLGRAVDMAPQRETYNFPAEADGYVLTYRKVSYEFQFSPCYESEVLDSGGAELVATASNYLGGSTEGHVIFRVVP